MSGDRKKEHVDHPAHYGGDTVYEVIKVLRAWGLTCNFNLGNAVKYLARAGKKEESSDVQDLEKALWYLMDEINWRVGYRKFDFSSARTRVSKKTGTKEE